MISQSMKPKNGVSASRMFPTCFLGVDGEEASRAAGTSCESGKEDVMSAH